MALLYPGRTEAERTLGSGRVRLRQPTLADFAEWAALREANRAFLSPWEPTWPDDDLTLGAFRRRLRRYQQEVRSDAARPFFVRRSSDSALVGACILSNIRRGVAQIGTLGYWIGEPFARQGLMSEAVKVACNFAFDDLGLHRLEAACLPRNEASQRLLRRIGFAQEGLARAYLKINGRWEDHILFALLANDPRSL